MGSRVALATTHHPQTDGQSERVIQTLTRIVRAYVRDQSAMWVDLLPLFQFALNNSASAATQLSPFQLMHGRDPVAPVNLMLGKSYDSRGSMELGGNRRVVAWARDWWKARRKLCHFAEENLRQGARLMKRRYDSQRKEFKAEPGDLVLLSVKSHPSFGALRKLRLRFTGPYVVKRKVHPNAFELEGLPSAVPATQNVSHLRLFHPSPRKFETRPHPARAALPINMRDHREWEVEAIVDHREVAGQRQYRLKWKDHDEPTWVRVSQLQHCADLLRDYQHEKGLSLDYWTESSSSPESQSDSSEEDEEIPGSVPSPISGERRRDDEAAVDRSDSKEPSDSEEDEDSSPKEGGEDERTASVEGSFLDRSSTKDFGSGDDQLNKQDETSSKKPNDDSSVSTPSPSSTVPSTTTPPLRRSPRKHPEARGSS